MVRESNHGTIVLIVVTFCKFASSSKMGGKLSELRFLCHVSSGDNLLRLTIRGVIGRSRGSANSFALVTCKAWKGEHDDPRPPPLVSVVSTCPMLSLLFLLSIMRRSNVLLYLSPRMDCQKVNSRYNQITMTDLNLTSLNASCKLTLVVCGTKRTKEV